MITRRDFIRGLGTAAVAVVMPKVKAAEAETLHVKYTEAELAYSHTWNPETGEETLITGEGEGWSSTSFADWGWGDDGTVYASLTEKGQAALDAVRREEDEDLF